MICRKIDVAAIFTNLRSVNVFWYLPIAVLISSLNLAVVRAIRWYVLIPGHNINFKKVVSLSYVGWAVNTVLPGNILGEIVKILKVDSHLSRESIIASIVCDRLITLLVMAIISIFCLFFVYVPLVEANLFTYIAIFLVLIVIAVSFTYSKLLLTLMHWIATFTGKFGRKITLILHSLSYCRKKKSALLQAMLVTVISVSMMTANFYLISIVLSVDISFWSWFSFVPLITIVSMAPITIGGLGIREYMIILLLGACHVPKAAALSISLFYFLVIVINILLGMLLFFYLEARDLKDDTQHV